MKRQNALVKLWFISSLLLNTLSQNTTKINNTHQDDERFLINTTGCYLPNYAKTIKYIELENVVKGCGKRLITIKKVSDYVVKLYINITELPESDYTCCYSFVTRSKELGNEDYKLVYSKCEPFNHKDEIKLKEEVITTSCSLRKRIENRRKRYYDKHLILKKIYLRSAKLAPKFKKHWNVIVLGMDTMSRSRTYRSLPEVVKYFRKNKWLDYRGYHKVDKNTFPNVMAMLTGKLPAKIYQDCSDSMEKCRKLIIWDNFNQSGYVTGFGEDSQRSMFYSFSSFGRPPTHHYARPMFESGEYRTGSITCMLRRPITERLLYYASQFVDAYQSGKFFGFFWLSSCSHDPYQLPQNCERQLMSFYKFLERIKVLKNTFVFFVGDHGINFGPNRDSTEAYYDSRLPMLFMWVPQEFSEIHPEIYENLKLNQYRLTTHFDLHATLWEILKLSNSNVANPRANLGEYGKSSQIIKWERSLPSNGILWDTKDEEDSNVRSSFSDKCTYCLSLTDNISTKRTCADANIDERWCACHTLTEVTDKIDIKRSAHAAFIDVTNMAFSAETVGCYKCSKLTLTKILRTHMYQRGDYKYFIVGFEVKPGGIRLEAKVENIYNKYRALHPTESMTSHNVRSFCAKTRKDFCVCLKRENCLY